MKTTKLDNVDHTSRVDTLVETYAQIAEQAFGNFLEEAIDPATAVGSCPFDDPGDFMDQYERRRVSGIKTIVFCAMAIEAAAFEFTAMKLGDHIASKYLDKMNLEGKWIIGTRLVCGQSLNINGPAINGLRSLVIARNALVHHKSEPADNADKAIQAMKKRWGNFEQIQVPNAFKTLVLLSLELESLPNTLHGMFPYYGKAILGDYLNDLPRTSGVNEVIERCRTIHRDHLRGA